MHRSIEDSEIDDEGEEVGVVEEEEEKGEGIDETDTSQAKDGRFVRLQRESCGLGVRRGGLGEVVEGEAMHVRFS